MCCNRVLQLLNETFLLPSRFVCYCFLTTILSWLLHGPGNTTLLIWGTGPWLLHVDVPVNELGFSENYVEVLDRSTQSGKDGAEKQVKQKFGILLKNASYRLRKTWMRFSGRDLAVSFWHLFDSCTRTMFDYRICSRLTMKLCRNTSRMLRWFISLKYVIL